MLTKFILLPVLSAWLFNAAFTHLPVELQLELHKYFESFTQCVELHVENRDSSSQRTIYHHHHHHHHQWSSSMPLQERRCFHDITPLFTVISSVPGRPQPQILLCEVVLDGTQPCLTRTTARSSPLVRRVVDASVEGTTCMVLIGVRVDDVTE